MAVNGRDGCPKSSEGRCPFDEAAEEHEDDSGHFIINLSVLRSLNMIARRRHHMMIPRSQRAGYVQSLNRENPFRCSKLMSQLDDLYVLNLQMRFYWLRKHSNCYVCLNLFTSSVNILRKTGNFKYSCTLGTNNKTYNPVRNSNLSRRLARSPNLRKMFSSTKNLPFG
ncbi:unnamed protein product [Lepeophtheirus salmonis]|uniref:(salmon louse) hypothetical protein n=1 Tax=Lepeophtheirus salmonis TaxID=72036 RepID=A0A7R8H7P2_LEPSM|nr:unnamed protein product [Lepeophtheirus salmonis]CAF2914528.1 unnamed protein product [Lepeophtheirus salmonis]